MKLARKLMVALMAAMIIVLILYAWLSVQRELRLFDTQMRRKAHLIGSVLALHMAEIWETSGSERALKLIEEANRAVGSVQIRWVLLNASEESGFRPRVEEEELLELASGREVVAHYKDAAGEDFLCTYVPLGLEGGRAAALEIMESMEHSRNYTRVTYLRKLLLIGVMLLVSSFLVFALGAIMVGRPIQRLVDQSRRIAGGQPPAEIVHRDKGDELDDLGRELDLMFRKILQSQDQLRSETRRRISALEQLRHAERLATIGKLSSGLAHELGTPLNVVSGTAKMLEAGDISNDLRARHARVIREQCERMTRIVRQLLTFSRRHTPQKASVDLEDCVLRTMDVVAPIAREKRVKLHLVPVSGPCRVQADEAQLGQVITNLFMNAVESMSGGGDVDVQIRLERLGRHENPGPMPGDYVCLEFRDQGAGVRPEDLEHIFDPFFTTKRAGEGTGLGLSIADDIVREHGGWISVDSKHGEGSVFIVYLPLEEDPCTETS